jgi:hypothetical protein
VGFVFVANQGVAQSGGRRRSQRAAGAFEMSRKLLPTGCKRKKKCQPSARKNANLVLPLKK